MQILQKKLTKYVYYPAKYSGKKNAIGQDQDRKTGTGKKPSIKKAGPKQNPNRYSPG